MSSSIAQNIEALCQEQGIERDLVIEAMKEAVRAAAKKQFRSGEDIQVDWNPETGIELSATKVVVDEVANEATELSIDEARELAGEEVELGDALLLPLPMEELGRIAAQTAKQILFQKVRDAVRSNVYEQYIDKIGDLVNGYVKRFERGNIIVDLGNLEAILPRSQQSRGEQWNQGERIRVVINNVSKESKGPQVEVSRTSPELLLRLFEMEVPEIYDGTVVIKSAVREPGERAKIAVTSNERDVDPVGACVGMKGSRVQAIIRELRGEKIDIIEWSDEPSVFAANALSPAKVNQVRITDIENRQMEVIVNEDQLSLAIGKRGQNVRLATKLVGWNIDIRSEEEIKREVTEQMGALIASGESVPLSAIEGVTAQQAETLAEHGINDIDALSQTSVDDLVEFLDLSLDEAEVILNAAVAVVAMRDKTLHGVEEDAESAVDAEELETSAADETGETVSEEEEEEEEEEKEVATASAAGEEEAADETPEAEDDTARGYDEAVETRAPYGAEPEIRAQFSADPVALTEAEPFSEDELILLETGRDLRPDSVVPAPDITPTEAAVLERFREIGNDEELADEFAMNQEIAELDSETQTSAPAVSEDAASSESTDDAKRNASSDDAAN
ncbi:MAG TPA: transcription termination factor NusA [Pyrinomonadaceae bacterium]|nr:transcription termination factor NusA [Pyrinomonadaceae bacterium]